MKKMIYFEILIINESDYKLLNKVFKYSFLVIVAKKISHQSCQKSTPRLPKLKFLC